MCNFYSLGLRPLVRTALAAAAGLCLACSSQSPTEKLLDTAQTASSWIATLRMTGEQWAANSVPTSFVETTVKAARSELEQEADDAAKSEAPPGVRDPFRRIVTEAGDVGKKLSQAAEENDRAGAAREVGRLAALQEQLAALRKQNGGEAQ
ncbi:MAG TPA: hypothetical protein VIJ61_19000 [Thermoanaerobaculia bacterium]